MTGQALWRYGRIIIIIIATVIAMALLIKATYITRGYFAFGGEWLVWAFPALWWAISKAENA